MSVRLALTERKGFKTRTFTVAFAQPSAQWMLPAKELPKPRPELLPWTQKWKEQESKDKGSAEGVSCKVPKRLRLLSQAGVHGRCRDAWR